MTTKLKVPVWTWLGWQVGDAFVRVVRIGLHGVVAVLTVLGRMLEDDLE